MIDKEIRQIVWRCAAIVAAGICIGIAFNSASPLGVRWSNRPERPAATPAEPQAITWEEAQQLMEAAAAVLVDVRPRTAFHLGHIPGAVSLPAKDLMELMPDFVAKYDRDTLLVVYCGDQNCASSEQTAKVLAEDYDYRNVMYLKGGFAEWQAAQHDAPAEPEDTQ